MCVVTLLLAGPYGYPIPTMAQGPDGYAHVFYGYPGMQAGHYGAGASTAMPQGWPAAAAGHMASHPHLMQAAMFSQQQQQQQHTSASASVVTPTARGPSSGDRGAAMATVRATTQLGGPMKSSPTADGRALERRVDGLTSAEYDKVLDMSTTEFNRYLKVSQISQEEIVDLRKARRRKKNRLYAKRSRGKKHTKLLELQATVSQLAAAAANGGGGGSMALQAARRAVAEYRDDSDDEDDDDEDDREGAGSTDDKNTSSDATTNGGVTSGYVSHVPAAWTPDAAVASAAAH